MSLNTTNILIWVPASAVFSVLLILFLKSISIDIFSAKGFMVYLVMAMIMNCWFIPAIMLKDLEILKD